MRLMCCTPGSWESAPASRLAMGLCNIVQVATHSLLRCRCGPMGGRANEATTFDSPADIAAAVSRGFRPPRTPNIPADLWMLIEVCRLVPSTWYLIRVLNLVL